MLHKCIRCFLQMHIHLARVFPSMHATIAGAFWGLELTQFDLDCGAVVTSGTRLKNCKIATKTSTNPKLPVRNRPVRTCMLCAKHS